MNFNDKVVFETLVNNMAVELYGYRVWQDLNQGVQNIFLAQIRIVLQHTLLFVEFDLQTSPRTFQTSADLLNLLDDVASEMYGSAHWDDLGSGAKELFKAPIEAILKQVESFVVLRSLHPMATPYRG